MTTAKIDLKDIIDWETVEFSHFDIRDYPDFPGVIVERACRLDGKEFTEEQLDRLQDDYGHELHAMMIEQLF